MAFKLVGQLIHVLPLKGCFIELHLGGDVVGNKVDFIALKNTEGLCPDFVEGSLLWDTVIRKKSQYLPGPVEVLVALGARLIHTIFGNRLGRFMVSSDMMDKTTQQIVMQSL